MSLNMRCMILLCEQQLLKVPNPLRYLTLDLQQRISRRKLGQEALHRLIWYISNDGKEIAVKVLGSNNTHQGKKEFANEVILLSRIHHRNLVKFYGFCQEEGTNILVYEFMHNGTLKEHLYGPLAKEHRIKSIKRLQIGEESAKGIEYLHTGCAPSNIHRDLKTSYVLLDINMTAKVSDFGLSKLAVDGNSHVSSIVRGTLGYLDPEYTIGGFDGDKHIPTVEFLDTRMGYWVDVEPMSVSRGYFGAFVLGEKALCYCGIDGKQRCIGHC